ncbi:hypothetical protein PCC9214_02957 [Planktothrix tepida]|uniref:DUF2809 domain-containing protein n=2 Tax=Planktothrix TaxID=54304 RepID=A0A1J1LNG5_9CYAN|nr:MULTISPECIES: DUF2809 domain-containing protein [Planktothrix]CAD5953064.1 hypothetical protein NO713_02702 [Planktothrix pseudagardhii]CAD5957470.1 hypothetical protein PCC9214_02957 [Planktothrix tepida]CUR34043.1 conserved membrane hypothetical protein [Planktothrix tepida PCC 9214]
MKLKQYQQIILISLIALIPIGLASKFYKGPFDLWLNNSVGGVFYEIFWVLLVVFINPILSPGWVAFWVFIVTSILEFAQLWKPPFLEVIRATLLGRLLLGTTFSWWDFPYYVIGCGLAWLGLKYLKSSLKSID